jgi:hypothetical protein
MRFRYAEIDQHQLAMSVADKTLLGMY